MDEPQTIDCDECGVWFYVVWNRNAVYEKPEYCPFCGEELDYVAKWQEQEDERS